MLLARGSCVSHAQFAEIRSPRFRECPSGQISCLKAMARNAKVGAGALAGTSLAQERRRRVEEAFATLPERYLGAAPGFDATYEIRLGDVGRTWHVCATADDCEVRLTPWRRPDVVIGTDSAT